METVPYSNGIKLPVSKKANLLAWLCCLVFVIIAGFLFSNQPFMAILSIAFFGLGVILLPIMMFHKESGLYILPEGINIVTPMVKDSMVAWCDIKSFSLIAINGNKMIAVHLKHPEAYLSKLKIWQRTLGSMSAGLSGTPYSISPRTYGCTAEELIELLKLELKKHKPE